MRLSEEQWAALARRLPRRQLLAFRLVFSEGLTYEKAGQTMGIGRDAVAHLIKRLKAKYPECVPKERARRIYRLNLAIDDEQIERKF